MPFSDRDLSVIAAQASTLRERLKGDVFPEETEDHAETVAHRLDQWRRFAAGGEESAFVRRLARDGLTEEAVRPLLGAVRWPADRPLPAWTRTLNAAMEPAAGDAAGDDRFLDPDDPLPFEELCTPFVRAARRRLKDAAGNRPTLLSDTAHASLERSLLHTLTRVSARVFNLEFTLSRLRSGTFSRLDRWMEPSGPPSRAEYAAFITDLLQDGLPDLFREYAVLARLMASMTDLWVETCAEFLERLEADGPDLAAAFFTGKPPAPVTEVRTGLSDRHRRGRSVFILAFASSGRLVYKPRDLGMEAAWGHLLAWCSARGAPLDFKIPAVLNRGTHGWVEHVAHRPCLDETAVRRYYTRVGLLLALLYVLEATDVHFENLIACGEHPVLIDAETLLHPRARDDASIVSAASGVGSLHPRARDDALLTQTPGAARLAYRHLQHSVMKSGFLPRWTLGQDGRTYDLSALGYAEEQETDLRLPVWKHVNTDRMALDFAYKRTVERENAPKLDGQVCPFYAYREEMVEGFRAMYRFLMRHRDALLADDGPLSLLAHQRVRFVWRPTKTYFTIMEHTLAADCMRDGADRSIVVDLLARGLGETDAPPPAWGLLAPEAAALERMDVPYFEMTPDRLDVPVEGGAAVRDFFAQSGFQQAVEKLGALSPEDMDLQIGVLRAACAARFGAVEAQPAAPASASSKAAEGLQPLPIDAYLAFARRIAGELRDRALVADDGSIGWIGFDYMPQAYRYQLDPLGDSLYSGAPGVALFLAALEHVTGDASYRDLAAGALLPVRETVRQAGADEAFAKRWTAGIGGGAGLGAIGYTLTRIGRMLNDPALIDEAHRAALLVTAGRIAQDGRLDVIGGAAGGILGLLAVYEATGDGEILERAAACGRHLVDCRIESETGFRAWKTFEQRPLTGFAHGAAGIGCALVRLYRATGIDGFLAAASEAFAYERSVFSPAHQNWPDFRRSKSPDGRPTYRVQWCHGAPGIGLARLAGLDALDTPEIREDIDAALRATMAFGGEGLDHLCCGGFGRADILMEAGRRLSRPAYAEAGERLIAGVVRRAEAAGYFRLFDDVTENLYNPALFQGTAGLGYQALRMAFPDRLPSVLLWG